MKIVVLAGGISTEREVSLVTGASVCRALRENGHRAILVDLFLGVDTLPEDPETLFDTPDGRCPDAEIKASEPDLAALCALREDHGKSHIGPHVLDLCSRADLVFLGLHGQDGEDGRMQATLDLLGVPYTGSGYLASGMGMDKAVTKQVMDAAGIPNPKWQVLRYEASDIDRLVETLPVPCVVKTLGGGSSLGVYLPEDRASLKNALTEVLRYGSTVLLEERIYGRDITVGVLGDEALPAVEIVPASKEFDYAAKYQKGGATELCPAPITPEQQQKMGELALRLHRALGMSVYSRTDFILDENGRPWCLEINSLPGMTSASLIPKEAAAVGIVYNDLCEKIVQLSRDIKRREY